MRMRSKLCMRYNVPRARTRLVCARVLNLFVVLRGCPFERPHKIYNTHVVSASVRFSVHTTFTHVHTTHILYANIINYFCYRSMHSQARAIAPAFSMPLPMRLVRLSATRDATCHTQHTHTRAPMHQFYDYSGAT